MNAVLKILKVFFTRNNAENEINYVTNNYCDKEQLYVNVVLDNGELFSVPTSFLKKLNTLRDLVRENLGEQTYEQLVRGDPVYNSEQTNSYLLDFLLVHPGIKTDVRRELQMLILFSRKEYVPMNSSVFVMLKLAEHFEYAELETLYDVVLHNLFFQTISVDTLLVLTRMSAESRKREEGIQNFISSSIKRLEENTRFSIENKYARLSQSYTFDWQISDASFKSLFSEERILSAVSNTYSTRPEVVNSFVVALMVILKTRLLTSPGDSEHCARILKIYSLEEVVLANRTVLVPVNTEVNLLSKKKIEARYLKYSCWNKLVIDERIKISSLFHNGQDREVQCFEVLNFYSAKEKICARKNLSNKIIVSNELTVKYVNGEIDFVDVARVKRMTLCGVNALRFYDKDKFALFESIKTVVLQNSSLRVLLHDDDSPVFPTLELLELSRCVMTREELQKAAQCAKTVVVTGWNSENEETLERFFSELRIENVFFFDHKHYLCRFNSKRHVVHELRERHGITDTESYEGRVVTKKHELYEICTNNSTNTIRDSLTKEQIRNTIVKVDYNPHDMTDWLAAVEDELVFLLVSSFRSYKRLRRVCYLRSLRYLDINQIDPEDTRLDENLEGQKITAIIIGCLNAPDFKNTLVRAFDGESLRYLEVNIYSMSTYSDFKQRISTMNANLLGVLRHFENVTFLTVSLNALDENAESSMAMLGRLTIMKRLEVLKLIVGVNEESAEAVTFSTTWLSKVLEENKGMRKVVIQLNRSSRHFYREMRRAFRTRDGRVYVLNATYSDMNAYSFVVNDAVKMISTETYDKMETESAMMRHCGVKKEARMWILSCVYELL